MRKKQILAILFMLLSPVVSYSQEVDSYLVTSNMGEYVFRPKRVITIGNAGFLVPTAHFPGHGDMTYEGIYIHPQTYIGVTVQVTKHSNADSDKWLLHEVDASFRNYYGRPGQSYIIRQINGNAVILYGAGGWSYRWISGNKVINIEYTDLEMTKPEPLDVVQAYLTKHPSTLPDITATIQRSEESVTKWIKDEMDRRLWLCDKWFMQLQLKKVEEMQVYQESVKSMNIFLDYREKYFSIKAADEKNLLAGYLSSNNGTSIKAKVTEYKNWWSVHKSDAISF